MIRLRLPPFVLCGAQTRQLYWYEVIFLNTSHSMDMRPDSSAFVIDILNMFFKMSMAFAVEWWSATHFLSVSGGKRCAQHCSCIPSFINNITEVRLPHLGMFVRGPFWQSAATCRVPLRALERTNYAENSASETIYLQSINNSPYKINFSLDLPLKNCAR